MLSWWKMSTYFFHYCRDHSDKGVEALKIIVNHTDIMEIYKTLYTLIKNALFKEKIIWSIHEN